MLCDSVLEHANIIIIILAFASAGVSTIAEPTDLCADHLTRPDGVTNVPWRRGKCLAWDVTCPDTFASSHLATTSVKAGSAAATAEVNKKNKYSDLRQSIDFVPVALETSGVWGPEGCALIRELGRRIGIAQHDTRSTMFLLQRISIAVQRGNAECILVSLRPSEDECLELGSDS